MRPARGLLPVRVAPALILAGLLATPPGAAQVGSRDDARETRERLSTLEADIEALVRAQRRDERQRGALQAQLRETEQALGEQRRAQRATASAIDDNRVAIAALAVRQAELRDDLEAQQDAVRRELRAAWRSGEAGQLKLLLNGDDPQQLARMLAYYRRLIAARSAVLDAYEETLAALTANIAELDAREQRLAAQRREQEQQLAKLEGLREERASVLEGIEEQLAAQTATLEARRAEREELEALLEEIEAALAQLIPEENVEAFSSARGQMPWPTQGRITDGFGRPRAQGKLRWQGVRIRAETGSPVSAIHPGRVVYADWLRGSGLLLVIDHGEGYMSLYAHNASLLREVGDWVDRGAPIATVGDTGGQSEAGLYFEIRKDGKPIDPAAWCRRQLP